MNHESYELAHIDPRGCKSPNGWTLTFYFECELTSGGIAVFRAKTESELLRMVYNLNLAVDEWYENDEMPHTSAMLETTLFEEAKESWIGWSEDMPSLNRYRVYWCDADGYIHDVNMEELNAAQAEIGDEEDYIEALESAPLDLSRLLDVSP